MMQQTGPADRLFEVLADLGLVNVKFVTDYVGPQKDRVSRRIRQPKPDPASTRMPPGCKSKVVTSKTTSTLAK